MANSKWFVQKIPELDAELAVVEEQINQRCQEIPRDGNILEILGIGENTLSGIVIEAQVVERVCYLLESCLQTGKYILRCQKLFEFWQSSFLQCAKYEVLFG